MPTAPSADHKKVCYDLKYEYAAGGCPAYAGQTGWNHPFCVNLRSQINRNNCAGAAWNTPRRGLGDGTDAEASIEAAAERRRLMRDIAVGVSSSLVATFLATWLMHRKRR